MGIELTEKAISDLAQVLPVDGKPQTLMKHHPWVSVGSEEALDFPT